MTRSGWGRAGRLARWVGLVGCLVLPAPGASADDYRWNLNLLAGWKAMDAEQWEPIERQTEFGLLVDLRERSWPVGGELAFLASSADESERTFGARSTAYEYHVGLRKTWNDSMDSIDQPGFRPYAGLGLAMVAIHGALDREGLPRVHGGDFGFGPWVGAGLCWTPAGNLNLGLDARWSSARVRLFDEEFDAGGIHLGVFLGWRWYSL